MRLGKPKKGSKGKSCPTGWYTTWLHASCCREPLTSAKLRPLVFWDSGQLGTVALSGTSFAYSLFVHSFHARRDRVVLLATVQFVWRGYAKTPTTRTGPWHDVALRLE